MLVYCENWYAATGGGEIGQVVEGTAAGGEVRGRRVQQAAAEGVESVDVQRSVLNPHPLVVALPEEVAGQIVSRAVGQCPRQVDLAVGHRRLGSGGRRRLRLGPRPSTVGPGQPGSRAPARTPAPAGGGRRSLDVSESLLFLVPGRIGGLTGEVLSDLLQRLRLLGRYFPTFLSGRPFEAWGGSPCSRAGSCRWTRPRSWRGRRGHQRPPGRRPEAAGVVSSAAPCWRRRGGSPRRRDRVAR